MGIDALGIGAGVGNFLFQGAGKGYLMTFQDAL